MKQLLDALVKDIEKSWDSNKIHVQPHSSGYDSRLLSSIIKKLYEKNGPEWLGEIYFICWQPEIKQFLDIMVYEGWSDKHIVLIKPDAQPLDYFAEAMEFANMGKIKYVHRFICRCFDYILDKEIDKLGNDVQLISGLWSDEVLRKGKIWNTKDELHAYIKKDIHFDWDKYDTMLPFMSDEFVDTFSRINTDLAPDEVKISIINALDVGLSSLENYRFKYWKIMKSTGTHPVYKISKETQRKAQLAYNNSKYRKDTNINITIPGAISNKDEAFIHYMKSAIMEAVL